MKLKALRSILIICLLFLTNCSDDSSTIEPEVPNIDETYPYRISKVSITTDNNTPITSKEEYVKCSVSVESEHLEWNYLGKGKIRGRGNSTWLWYPKKPYRIKLDEKAEILGLAEEKDWVLLADYRDPTHLMNTLVFTIGEGLGLPYTNHVRYVEVTLNNQYIGMYILTEQVEQGNDRVAISETEGTLISLDADDGPELNPMGGDNFWSTVYRMPVCVKSPDGVNTTQLRMVQDDLGKLEKSIQKADYDAVAKQMNIKSFIDYMLIQELVYNVEVAAPRSINMHKDKGGLWTMGPLWDFDAGFDFDWGTMYTGHNYFANYKELVLGTNPSSHVGGYIVPSFFTDLFKSKRFVSEYKARWKEVKSDIMSKYWKKTNMYVTECAEAYERNLKSWPIDKSYKTEIERMKNWLTNRINYLDIVIQNYP